MKSAWFAVALAVGIASTGCGNGDCSEESCTSGTRYLSCVQGSDLVILDSVTEEEFSRCETDYSSDDPINSSDANNCAAVHAQSKYDFCAQSGGTPGEPDGSGTGSGGPIDEGGCDQDGTICGCPYISSKQTTPIDSCGPEWGICCESPTTCTCGPEQYAGAGCLGYGSVNESPVPVASCGP